jgi:uncharacterized membrane protein (UPF0136 family)
MLKTYLLVFGLIVIGAAVQGFLAGSKASLIAGGILGICLLAGAFLLADYRTVGLILALVGSLGIAGRFIPAFFKASDKVAALWPAGVLALLAVIGLVLTIKEFLRK